MRIELDTVIEAGEKSWEVASHWATRYGVKAEVVTEHGPAGGNPIIAYEGDEDKLRELVLAEYGRDALETAFA